MTLVKDRKTILVYRTTKMRICEKGERLAQPRIQQGQEEIYSQGTE